MEFSTEKFKKIMGINILVSCLKYSKVKMLWLDCYIPKSMKRDEYFSTRSYLKVEVEDHVGNNNNISKVRMIQERVGEGGLNLERQKKSPLTKNHSLWALVAYYNM